MPATEVCSISGAIGATFYKWRANYGSMDVSMLSKVNQLPPCEQVKQQLDAWIWMYNIVRSNMANGGMPPVFKK